MNIAAVPAQRIDHSSVPLTPTTTFTFPYRSAIIRNLGSEQTSSTLTSIHVKSNACVKIEAQDVGYLRTLSHGLVDPSPLSTAYRKKARKVEVVVAGHQHQSVYSLPNIYTRPSYIWPVACEYNFNHRVLFTVSFGSQMFRSCAKAHL